MFFVFSNGMKFGFFFLVLIECFFFGKSSFSLVMCQCFRNVGIVERCVRFFVFESPVGALHAELAVEGEQRCVAVCSARICSSCLLLLRVSCSKPPWALLFLFFPLFTLSLPVLTYCLVHRWPVLSLCYLMPSLCYLCAISLIFLWNLCLYALVHISF